MLLKDNYFLFDNSWLLWLLPSQQIKTTKKIARVLQKSFKRRKIKTINCANIRNKNMSDWDRERKKEFMKNYYYKRKNLFNNIMSRIGKLESVSFSK